MADINLKTETPDTSLPTTGFLFGADSQAAASPSVYTTQAVATTLLGSTTLNGETVTANAPVWNLTQTWNNSGVTFTALKLNVTNTAAGGSSVLMDLQVDTASKFAVSRLGTVSVTGAFSSFASGGSVSPNFWAASNTGSVAFGSSLDAFLSRRGAANLRLGVADVAAPVAQTLSVQSVVAGTSNTAGVNFTLTGSQGTGTGLGGSFIFQVAPAGSSGTAQNALVAALTISGAGNVSIGNAAIATNATDGFLYVPSCAGTPTGTPTTVTGRVPIVVDTTNNKLYFYSSAAWRDAGP